MTVSSSFFSLARRAYRTTVAPVGRIKVQRMLAEGLPQPFQHPLEFLFGKRLSQLERRKVSGVELIRAAVKRQVRPFEVVNREGQVRRLTSSEITGQVSVSP